MKYLIQSYQVVWHTGGRDTVKLKEPILTGDLEATRKMLKNKHAGCAGINLTYIEYAEK